MTNDTQLMLLPGYNSWARVVAQNEGHASCRDLLQKAGADWTISKRDAFYQTKTGEFVAATSAKLLVRDDTGTDLACVGSRYPVVQNTDLFDVLDHVPGIKYLSAGVLGGGRTVFVELQLGDTEEVLAGDAVQSHAIVVNRHGSGAIVFAPMMTRLGCWNRVEAVANSVSRNHLRIPHIGRDLAARVSRAGLALAESRKFNSSLVASYREMTRKQVTDETIQQMIRRSLPTDMTVAAADKARQLIETKLDEERQRLGGQNTTLWSVFNAVTEYADHDRRAHTDAVRLQSNLFGSSRDIKARALRYAEDLLHV